MFKNTNEMNNFFKYNNEIYKKISEKVVKC